MADTGELQPIAALFVIRFDQRIGYTTAWHRAVPGLELAGVEYKSLPSGLHNVTEDSIYFTHSDYAGVSAFKSEAAAESERNARFVSVGVLVPKHASRLGRAWLHVDGVKGLAAQTLAQPEVHGSLEKYWNQHHSQEIGQTPSYMSTSTKAVQNREASHDTHGSDITHPTRLGTSELPPNHPILSLTEVLDVFGPLMFPLYRATLLKRRVLFISKPPLSPACNFVYILSILASIPPTVGEALPETAPRSPWSPPLFSLGIHDIPYLESLRSRLSTTPPASSSRPTSTPEGWIACTSDALLATKEALSDVRVTLPGSAPLPGHALPSEYPLIHTTSKNAPAVRGSTGTKHSSTTNPATTKASQRDLRRYKALRQDLEAVLQRRASDQPEYRDDENATDISDNDNASLLSRRPSSKSPTSHSPTAKTSSQINIPYEDQITEQLPWAAALYSSYMWWASGSQQGFGGENDETEADRSIWAAASEALDARSGNTDAETDSERRGALEMAMVAYFHGVTERIFEVLGGIVEAQRSETDGVGEPEQNQRSNAAAPASDDRVVSFTTEDLVNMGLDAWSAADRDFVKELCKLYFGCEAEVGGGKGVEICGVRIC